MVEEDGPLPALVVPDDSLDGFESSAAARSAMPAPAHPRMSAVAKSKLDIELDDSRDGINAAIKVCGLRAASSSCS